MARSQMVCCDDTECKASKHRGKEGSAYRWPQDSPSAQSDIETFWEEAIQQGTQSSETLSNCKKYAYMEGEHYTIGPAPTLREQGVP